MHVALMGAGLMGSAMAVTLSQAGHVVNVYNRSPEKLLELQDQGVNTSTDPGIAIEQADCIITMLSDYAVIDEVMLHQVDATSLQNKTIIQMATISPSQSQQLQTAFAQIGCTYLECPVLGSIPEAKSASLILMVGASQAQFDVWRDFLTNLGPNPIYLGEVGRAAAVKLAMNHLIGALTAAFSTSLAYIQQNDVQIEPFMDIVRDSALYAKTYDKKLARMLNEDFSKPNFPTKHLLKDLDLFLASMTEHELNRSAVEGIKDIVAKAVNKGFADSDYSALYTGVKN